MAQNKIENKVFQIKKETVRLTAETDASGSRTIPVLPASEISPVPTLLEDTKIFGDGIEREALSGIREFTGTLELEPGADKLGELFLSLFGSVTTDQPDVGNAPSVYRHRFTKAATAQNPTHTLFIDRGTHIKRYGGLTCSQMTLNYPVDGRIAASADVMAVAEATHGSSLTPSFTGDLRNLLFSDMSIDIAGSGNSLVRTASVVILNNLVQKRILGSSRDPVDLCAGRLQANGSFTLYFENDTERDKFVASTQTSIKLTAAGEVLEDVQVATLEIDMPLIKYTAGPISEQDGILVQDFTFNAYLESVAGYSVRPTLISTVVSY